MSPRALEANAMTYIVAIALTDRVRFADVTKRTPEDAMTVIWSRYPDARAVLIAGKDQRASHAPSQKDLFDLMVARASPLRQPDKSFRCDEAAARKLMVNVLENPDAELIRWDADAFNKFAEQAQTPTEDEAFAEASVRARAAVKAAKAAAMKMQAAIKAVQAAAAEVEQCGQNATTMARVRAASKKLDAAGEKMKAADEKATAAVAEMEGMLARREARQEAERQAEAARRREYGTADRKSFFDEWKWEEEETQRWRESREVRSKWSAAFPQKPWEEPAPTTARQEEPAQTAARQERDAEYRRRRARHEEELDAERPNTWWASIVKVILNIVKGQPTDPDCGDGKTEYIEWVNGKWVRHRR
jgi:hypothetical protein